MLQQQLTGSDHGTGLVTRSLVQKLRSRRFHEENYRHEDEEEIIDVKILH